MNIVVITTIPSPYQIEYFDSISSQTKLRAVYLHTSCPTGSWKTVQPNHESLFLDRVNNSEARLCRWIDEADLVVFSHYRSSIVRRAMARRQAAGQPWCFWGERLGYRGLGWFGSASRYFLMRSVQRSRAPIWAMGSWAIESYRRECGSARQYFNVPYCSNLSRFRAAGEQRTSTDTFRFLYSGSLIHRKGVDLLSLAFNRLARQLPRVSLAVIGHGPLRSKMEAILMSVSDRVTFIGPIDWQALPVYYAQADVLCAPSRYDGWGLIVPEGLASGLPVIATNCMGAAFDLIRPGINGWSIPAGDENTLYRAMLEAVTMGSSKRRDMSECAKTVIETHNLHAGTDRFLDAAWASRSEWLTAAIQA